MTFRNKQDLLIYLVALSDTEDAWRLQSGQQLGDHLRIEGRLDSQHPDREYAELGRMLWSLKEDGSIRLEDTAMGSGPTARVRPAFGGFTMDDVFKFSGIEVTGQGRAFAQTARPAIAINVANIDMTVLLSAVEEEVAAIDAPDEIKDEARSKLHAAREVLVGVGSGATAEVIAAALRRTLGLP